MSSVLHSVSDLNSFDDLDWPFYVLQQQQVIQLEEVAESAALVSRPRPEMEEEIGRRRCGW
jgi:hypothetical protein